MGEGRLTGIAWCVCCVREGEFLVRGVGEGGFWVREELGEKKGQAGGGDGGNKRKGATSLVKRDLAHTHRRPPNWTGRGH
jgi:hypothetical protein